MKIDAFQNNFAVWVMENNDAHRHFLSAKWTSFSGLLWSINGICMLDFKTSFLYLDTSSVLSNSQHDMTHPSHAYISPTPQMQPLNTFLISHHDQIASIVSFISQFQWSAFSLGCVSPFRMAPIPQGLHRSNAALKSNNIEVFKCKSPHTGSVASVQL